MIRVATVLIKKFLVKYFRGGSYIPSFCKVCGRSVRYFIAGDTVWAKIDPLIKRGNIVCYNCFCDLCGRVDLPTVWTLERPLPEASYRELLDRFSDVSIEAFLRSPGARPYLTAIIDASSKAVAESINEADDEIIHGTGDCARCHGKRKVNAATLDHTKDMQENAWVDCPDCAGNKDDKK